MIIFNLRPTSADKKVLRAHGNNFLKKQNTGDLFIPSNSLKTLSFGKNYRNIGQLSNFVKDGINKKSLSSEKDSGLTKNIYVNIVILMLSLLGFGSALALNPVAGEYSNKDVSEPLNAAYDSSEEYLKEKELEIINAFNDFEIKKVHTKFSTKPEVLAIEKEIYNLYDIKLNASDSLNFAQNVKNELAKIPEVYKEMLKGYEIYTATFSGTTLGNTHPSHDIKKILIERALYEHDNSEYFLEQNKKILENARNGYGVDLSPGGIIQHEIGHALDYSLNNPESKIKGELLGYWRNFLFYNTLLKNKNFRNLIKKDVSVYAAEDCGNYDIREFIAECRLALMKGKTLSPDIIRLYIIMNGPDVPGNVQLDEFCYKPLSQDKYKEFFENIELTVNEAGTITDYTIPLKNLEIIPEAVLLLK